MYYRKQIMSIVFVIHLIYPPESEAMNGADDPQKASPESEHNPPPPPPGIPLYNQGVLGKGEPDTTKEDIKETKKLINETRTVEWLQLAVNAVLAAVGIGALIIYRGQLTAMNAQTRVQGENQAQTSIDSKNNAATTAQQLQIAQGQLDQQVNAMKMAQRGWIEVDLPPANVPFPTLGKPEFFPFAVKGYGNTPTFGIDGQARVELIYGGQVPSFQYPHALAFKAGVLEPGGKPLSLQDAVVEPAPKGSKDKSRVHLFTASEVDDVAHGRAHFFIFGKITYTDFFGDGHWYHFCEKAGFASIMPPDFKRAGEECTAYENMDKPKRQANPN